MLSKGPPTATVMCKYLPFKATPPPSPMSKKEKLQPTSIPKKLWVKVSSKKF